MKQKSQKEGSMMKVREELVRAESRIAYFKRKIRELKFDLEAAEHQYKEAEELRDKILSDPKYSTEDLRG